ncbi:probable basic-leucine zipper transcription factor R [Bombina bombina]|uniref:probable basic-leucine zipper transcription factor R n=1 Tax=Bombina bombina TaxID=8345 RepID=UPI00235A6324|nr:probable basic-leucine zipper transcription factor R [Bombina bombina]XP_053577811.1 probable basic-leucine zipper transcription factor R [Bombina bombina]
MDFDQVKVYFSEDEWDGSFEEQRELYTDLSLVNYQTLGCLVKVRKTKDGQKWKVRERAERYTPEEKAVLIREVMAREDILWNKNPSSRERTKAWREITAVVCRAGRFRTVSSVKHRFQDCRLDVKKKMEQEAAGKEVKFAPWEKQLKRHLIRTTAVEAGEQSSQQSDASRTRRDCVTKKINMHFTTANPQGVLKQHLAHVMVMDTGGHSTHHSEEEECQEAEQSELLQEMFEQDTDSISISMERYHDLYQCIDKPSTPLQELQQVDRISPMPPPKQDHYIDYPLPPLKERKTDIHPSPVPPSKQNHCINHYLLPLKELKQEHHPSTVPTSKQNHCMDHPLLPLQEPKQEHHPSIVPTSKQNHSISHPLLPLQEPKQEHYPSTVPTCKQNYCIDRSLLPLQEPKQEVGHSPVRPPKHNHCIDRTLPPFQETRHEALSSLVLPPSLQQHLTSNRLQSSTPPSLQQPQTIQSLPQPLMPNLLQSLATPSLSQPVTPPPPPLLGFSMPPPFPLPPAEPSVTHEPPPTSAVVRQLKLLRQEKQREIRWQKRIYVQTQNMTDQMSTMTDLLKQLVTHIARSSPINSSWSSCTENPALASPNIQYVKRRLKREASHSIHKKYNHKKN